MKQYITTGKQQVKRAVTDEPANKTQHERQETATVKSSHKEVKQIQVVEIIQPAQLRELRLACGGVAALERSLEGPAGATGNGEQVSIHPGALPRSRQAGSVTSHPRHAFRMAFHQRRSQTTLHTDIDTNISPLEAAQETLVRARARVWKRVRRHARA